jgi:hypothetical protein
VRTLGSVIGFLAVVNTAIAGFGSGARVAAPRPTDR